MDLIFHDRAREAAWHILRNTVIGETLAGHIHDDGHTLIVEDTCDTYELLSSGERVLLGCLEMLAGRRSTVTLHDVGNRLDDPSRAAVWQAWGIYLRMESLRGAA
jgi:hypothetical protein